MACRQLMELPCFVLIDLKITEITRQNRQSSRMSMPRIAESHSAGVEAAL